MHLHRKKSNRYKLGDQAGQSTTPYLPIQSTFIIFIQKFCNLSARIWRCSHVVATFVLVWQQACPLKREVIHCPEMSVTQLLKVPQKVSFEKKSVSPHFCIRFQMFCDVGNINGIPQQQLYYHFHCRNRI